MYGTYSIGKGRVFGRVTLARSKEGIAFPVCIELYNPYDLKRGIPFDAKSRPGDVWIYQTVDIRPVERFE